MAGQGITVSIQAKIEGWQDQIKQIQNAMKNIKPGADISKGLMKDLQQVTDMVNNLGKNMNQRLTSDSQITGFVDKIMQVEEVFGRLGTSMSHISFGDIKPEYITDSFKDLLSVLEQANNALGQGMESSFQNAIAGSKTLQKEFERMKIDPKSMNIDAIREALAERGKSLEKDVTDGLKKLTDFEKGLEKLKHTRDELAARDKFLGKDASATAQSLLLGHELPTKGTILDSDELEKQLNFFRSNLLKVGFTPTQLGRIIPDLETVMKAGHWDEMPGKFAEYLREAQMRTRNSLTKASNDYKDAVLQHQSMAGAQNRLSSLRFNNTQAQNEVTNILSGTVQNETKSLRDIVNNVKQQLNQAVTSGFTGLGSKLFSSSQQGMQDASAAIKDYSAALDQVKAKEQAVSKVQGVVQRYFSIYAAIRMVSKGIRSMMDNIKDLDKTITEIAIVTKMDQNDLWGQMPQYTKLAKNYAASIKGVYEVSQLYYQQGLGQQDVMALTEQTLKMARISGLGYAEATDYMTNAVRSFKMEMTDAQRVVDVYSAVAASSASSVTELATAMSKTASSAQAVGASFENTTAMMAVMIEATRESPENIGSALKSIISRYGELKENKTGIDEEGEEYSLNKVDKALQTVGISIHDANGEFRDIDDVIFELSEHWNEIDKNTQRYIATVMAGNRQQSRFLALVSSAERLKEESEKAANSEDASQLQFLKTMDSIEAKTQQFQTSLQSLYTSSGLEKLYKGLLDFGNEFANTLENISGKQGLIGVISNLGSSFVNMATFATTGFSMIKSGFMSTRQTIEHEAKLAGAHQNTEDAAANYAALKNNPVLPIYPTTGKGKKGKTAKNQQEVEQYNAELAAAAKRSKESGEAENALIAEQQHRAALLKKQNLKMGIGMAASAAGMALGTWANTIDINENRGLKGGLTIGSSALSGLGTGLMVGASVGGPIGALVGGLTALPGIIQGIGMLSESVTERVQKLEKNVTEAKNEKIKSKDELKTLEEYKKKYDELSKAQYESAEKKKEFLELSNTIAASYPQLIKSMDAEGNYILNMTEGYEKLAEAKREAYREDLVNNAAAEIKGLKDADYVLKNIYGQTPIIDQKTAFGTIDNQNLEELQKLNYNEDQSESIKKYLTENNEFGAAVDTIRSLFGGNKEGYDLLGLKEQPKSYTGAMSLAQLFLPSSDFSVEITDEGKDIFPQLYSYFVEQAKDNIDLITAQGSATKQFGKEYEELINGFDSNFYNQLKLRFQIPDYQETLANNTISTYGTELVNLLSSGLEDNFDIESSDIQKRFIQKQLMDEWQTYYEENEQALLDGSLSWDDAVKEFFNKRQQIWYKFQRESEIISTLSDEANELYQNMGKHTSADIRALFPEDELTDLQQTQLDWLYEIFNTDFEDILKNYTDWLDSEEVLQFNVQDFSELIGPEYLSQIQAQYAEIISSNLSDTQKQTQISSLNNLYDTISTNKDLTFSQKSSILDNFISGDLTTVTGINKAINYIQGLDLGVIGDSIISNLKDVESNLNINFLTEFSNFSSEIVKQSQDFEKAISNATKGMDLKTAAEMAEKMGKTLKDFSYKDGKYYYENLSDIDEAYLSYDDQLLESLTERKDATIEMLQGFSLTNKKGQKFDTTRINEEGYLNEWQSELRDAEYLIEDGVLKTTHEEIISQTKEYFDQFKVDEEGYLDDWDNELRTVGLSADEYREILATGDLDKIYNELTERVRGLSRINEEVELTSVDITSEDFSTLQNLSKETSLGIETLIEQYGNDVEEVIKAINSDDFVTPENINKTSLIGYIEAFMSRTGEDLNLGWDEWIKKYLNDIYDANKTAIDEYRKDQKARTYLSNGRIDKFIELTRGTKSEDYQKYYEEALKTGVSQSGAEYIAKMQVESAQKWNKENEELIGRIASGDTSNLPENLQQYAKLIYDTFVSVQSTVTNAMFEAATGGQTSIWADEKNVNVLQQFTNKGWIKKKVDQNGHELSVAVGQQYEFDTEALKKDEEEFKQWVKDNKELTDNERAEYLKKYFDIKYPKAKSRESTLAMAEKTKFTYDDIQSYMDDLGVQEGTDVEAWAKANGLDINDLGEFFISSQEIWDKFLDDNLGVDDGSKEYRQIKAQLESIRRTSKNETKINTADAVSNLLKDTQAISEKSREALAEAIGDEDAAKYFKDNLDGTYTLDTAQLRQDVEDGTLKIYGEAKESILEGFASLGDEAISAVVNATQLITSGTNKQADMQKIVNAFNDKYSQGQLFKYDDILNAYTFNPAYLQEYQQIQAKEYAKAMGVTEDQALSEVRKQTQETLASQVDIDSFLKSENRGEGSKAREKLKKQLTDLYLAEMPDNLPEYAQKTYKDAAGLSAETSIKILEAGGQDAVEKAKELAEKADKELSTEDIESYFYSEVNRIKGYADSLTDLTTGQYVAEGDFKNILRSVGMIDSSGMVANIENMAAVYKAIYDTMGKTGKSTAAQLNEVYAKYLTETERGDIDAIAAMGDAMGMTYDTLGQILGREGTKLEDWMNNAANKSMYEKIGAGKVRITDFTKFAAQRGWEPGSEEYTSAFKAYNDSMIELNKKAKTSIQEEVSALESAKGGDQLNLTELYTKLATSLIPTDKIDAALKSNGAKLVNGILTLSDNANLIGVAQALKTAAEAAGSEMSAELQDMLLNVIKAYTEAITKGIEGGMSQVEAQDLTNKALSLGVTDLRFDTTADGLKLAQDSAIELYNTIKKIDALQGRVVFDKLAESLAENNENFTTTTEILSHIREINQELLTASGRRASALKQELEVAKEIVATRAGAEDQSYNFMSGDIPGGQKNMLTYARNWSQALQTIRDAYKVKGKTQKGEVTTGFISYENYYNIINELNRMAGMTGQALTIGNRIGEDAVTLDGTLESASKAIQQGIDNLGAVDSGDVMVNIGALGINLAKGGSNLENSVDKGVKAIAHSEMAALDGMIRVLELIVAMESLDDVAGDDMKITLPEIIFDSTDKAKGEIADAYEYTDAYSKFRDHFIKQIEQSPDLKKAAENFKVEGKSINEIINMSADEFMKNADLNTALLNAFYQASQSGNWDINNVAASLQEQLNQHFGELQDEIVIDVEGARLMIKNGLVVTVADWTDEDTKKIVEKYKKDKTGKDGKPMTDEEAQAEIGDAIQNYLNGQGTTTGIDVSIEDIVNIRTHHVIKYDKTRGTNGDKEKGYYFEDENGNRYYEKSQYNTPDAKEGGYKALLQKYILLDQEGVNAGDIDVDMDGGKSTVNATLNKKLEYNITVDADGTVHWTAKYKGKNIDGRNQEDFYNQLYNAYAEDFANNNQKAPGEKLKSKKEFLNSEMGIHYKINTKIAKDGIEIDTDSAEGQKKIREALENLPDELTANGEGNYEIPLGDGTVITLDPSDVEINGKYDKDAAKNALLKALGLDTALQETITNAIKDALQDLPELFKTLAEGPSEGAGKAWEGVFTAIAKGATTASTAVQALIDLLTQLNGGKPIGGGTPGGDNNGGDNTGGENGTNNKAEQEKNRVHQERVDNLITTPESAQTEAQAPTVTANVEADTTNAETAIEGLNPDITANVTPNPSTTALNQELSTPVTKTVYIDKQERGYKGTANINMTKAKGTVGSAFASGTPTLMGELGPELVVSGGRYYVVGQSGAEMVNLAQDAIVFNHLQTRSLLNNGHATRGQAVINERKATAAANSMAKGNVHGGPAMSSASAALAALKQLRAQWAALANLSAQDLAGAGGGGGGGGGGDKAFIKELERWYNLLQEIATLEAKISRETQIQAKIKSSQYKNGKQYFNSQARTLKDLQAEIKAQQTLNTQQQAYFNKRRKELNEDSPFSSLYTFDENGQLKYKEGAFEKLSKISGRDSSGKPNMTPEQQYKAILKMNPEFKKYMKYDSSGNKIKDDDYAAMVQAFWDKIEADKQEMQSLKDSINETGDKILELQTQQNEILQEMKDNQMAVENAVLDAIVDAAQREIDELQDTRDAIEDSNSKFISGLQDTLDKERQMYENQEKEDDLNSKLRQLAILQASGGPASEIASLQKEVDTAQRDVYFDKQQEQIDAIQEASDRQIEKLDQQIKLMQDTLDYEKAHGLLWNEVKEIMDRSPEEIAAFIHNNNSEYWDDSPVASEQALRDTLFQAQQWESFRDMTDTELKAIIEALGGEVEDAESQWNNFDQIMTEKYGDKWTNSANREKYKQQFLDKYNETGDYSQASAAVLDSEEFADENLPDDEDRKEKKWLVKQHQDGSWYVKEGTKKSKNRHKYDTAEKRVNANNQIWEEKGRPAKNSKKDKELKNKKKYKYDIGGMVNETGEALLHAKEAVLTPRQTHILRNDLLGSGKNSLATLLTDFRDAYQNLQTGDRVITNNSGLTIGNASVNMNVQKIANDYDAQRAGEQALSKMIEIARKTKAQNRIGG